MPQKTQKSEDSKTLGKKVKAFNLPTTSEKTLSSKDFVGQKTIIYFYPKDDTSGCTLEGEGFRDYHHQFKKLGVQIYGVSRDSITSHEKFKKKYKFPFELVSDEEETLCDIFDVMKEKSMYGRKYLGVDRSTFFINDKGVVEQEWRNVKVPGHVQALLDYAKEQE